MTIWISTGKAAALLGYSRDHFRRKFLGVILTRMRDRQIEWDAEAVIRVRDSWAEPTR